MSLKNASLDKGLIESIKAIDSLDNIEDIGKALHGKKADEIADILGRSKKNFDIDELSQIANIAGVTDDLGNLANMVDEVSDSQKGVNGLATSFKNLGKMIKTAVFNPYTAMIAGLVIAKKAIDAYYEKFDKLVTAAEDSQGAYASTVSELKTLDSEIETTSSKIAELESQGTLSITDAAELDRLKIQNLELERQRSLKQQLADEQSKAATKAAMEALTLQRTMDLTQQKAVPHGASRHDYIDPTVQYVNTDIVTAAKNEVAVLTELRDKRKELLTDDISDDSQAQEFEKLDAEISKFEAELGTHLTSIMSLRENFIDQSTGLVKENLTAEELDMFNTLSAILDDYNNIDLTPAERELNKIKQFFDGSFGKNQIKDYLLEATENGVSAAVAIERLGIDLESAGLDAQALNEYFREMRDSAENVKDSVQDYAATISDIETAQASEDQDKNWSTISEAYKEATELLKEGKTGTDNFQMMASFLNPQKVKDLAEEGGKYTADAYQKAFEDIKKTANRWFGEDETKSMENFVNDFKKAGLFDVETDDMGLWDITTNFETTAEAADKFNISIEAVETMLEALGAYGYEFEGITFSGDALSEYQSYLEGIRNLYNELEDSDLKDRLKGILDQADIDDFENNIESLSPEIVAEIEFAYDLAQIDREIQRLKAELSGAGYNDSGSNAKIIAANESRTKKWRAENSKAAKDTGYAGTDETIAKLERSMVGKSDEVIESTQRKIMALQDLRTAYENTFDASNGTISWEEFIGSAEADAVFSNLAEEFGIAKNDLEQMASEGVEVSITGNTTSFYNKLTGVLSNDGKTITMHIDATTEQIQAQIAQLQEGQRILFTAEVNGEPVGISVYKDIEGTVHYVAEDDGVAYFLEEHVNPDGTITYTPDTDAVDAYDYDQDGIVEYIGKFPKNAPKIYGYAEYTVTYRNDGSLPSENIRPKYATGTMLSPAHKDGTAYNVLNTLPAYSNGKVGLSEDQRALVNELGMESIVRDGVWRLLPGGAHLENLKKGDIIFNAAQTKDLLRSGKTPGRARAYAQGNVLSPAYRLGNYNNTGSSNTVVNTSKKSTKQVEKALEELGKAFDWITVKFERLARKAQKAEEAIERAQTLNKKLSATSDAISAVRAEKNAAKKAAAEYEKQFKQIAKSTGLSKSIQTKIQNGSISMGDYTDKTQEKISKYKEAYDNYLNAIDMVDELSAKERELALQRLDLVEESYNALKELKNSAIELNESRLNLIDAKGLSSVSDSVKAIYQDSLKHAKAAHTASVNEVNKYKAEIDRLIRDGYLVEGTQEYNEYLATLNDLEAASIEAEIAVIEFKDALREVEFERIQNFIDALDRAANKLQNEIDLMEARDEDIPESMYQEQIGLNNDRLEYLSQQLDMKRNEQAEVAVESDRYKELAEEIAAIEDEMYDLLIDNEKLKDSIAETRFAGVNEDIDNLNKLQAEISDTRSMLDSDDFLDDNGNITAEGSSNISLMREEISLLNQEIQKCNQALQELEAAYASGLISEKEYKEMTEQYKDTIREATKDIDSLEDSIEDLYESQREAQKAAARKRLEKEYEAARKRLEKENELLKENIEKRREALQRKADYYDYDRTIRHKEKDINMLKAQIAAMDGVTDAAAMAEKRRLEAQLKEAQDDLEATKHQHAIDMQLQELDDLEREIDKTYDRNLEALEEHIDRQEEMIDNMLGNVVNKYDGAYSQINGIIDKTNLNISNSFKELNEYLNSAENVQGNIDSSNNNQSQSSSGSSSNAGSSTGAGSSSSGNSNSDTSKYEEQLKQPENTTNRPVAAIILDKTSVSVNEGTSKTVKVKEIKPSDAANQNVKWKSSDTKIATVSGGKIKGVKVGSCTVTCTAADGNGANATITVTVKATTKVDSSGINAGANDTKPTTNNNNNSSNNASGSDNKITKGEKVTFNKGKYTEKADGGGASGDQMLGKEVYVTIIKSGASRPYHIAKKKDGSGALGWVKKEQLKGYAKGLYKANHSEWAFTNEDVNGRTAPEIVVAPDGGILTKIEPGSSVIPHNFAQNLFELGANPNLLENAVTKQIKVLVNNLPSHLNENLLGQITNHYDSLLTVNGNVDKDALPGLQELLKQSYQYTSQQLTKDAKKLGIRGIR